MKFPALLVLLFYFPLSIVGQGFNKEDIKKHRIKKIFINGPDSRDYEVEEYDTAGNLLTTLQVRDSMPPFVREELKYISTLLVEKRKHESYSPDRIEIIQYFYNGKGLLVREEDTVICAICKIPKRITQYEYDDSNRVILEKYQAGDFNTLTKTYYGNNEVPRKIEAWVGREKDFVRFFFYDDHKNLKRDSVYNFMSKGSLRNYYKYNADSRLTELKNMSGKIMYYQLFYTYDEEGLLKKIINKQKADESKNYYTSETYFNFEKY